MRTRRNSFSRSTLNIYVWSIHGFARSSIVRSTVIMAFVAALTASNAQTLVIGQAQLALVQQNHALLYPQVRSMLYSST